jgi:hypothetical protein
MTPTHRRRATRLLTTAVSVVGLACAEKRLLDPTVTAGGRAVVQLVARNALSAPTASLTQPLYVVAAVAYKDKGESQFLGLAVAPASAADIPLSVSIDLTPCLEANARAGKAGCSLYAGAVLLADTSVLRDTTADVVSSAYDFSGLQGPYEVLPGRAVTIPPIDLASAGYAAVGWAGDYALQVGTGRMPFFTTDAPTGGIAAISGVVGTDGTPTIFVPTFGPVLTDPPQPSQFARFFPQLAIFENGRWQRVSASNERSQFGDADYNAVTAVSRTDAWMTASNGLWHYTGTAIVKADGVTGPLFTVGHVVSGSSRLVIAGGEAGAVWIGDGQTFQRTVIPNAGRVTDVCLTSPTEAFAIAANAAYRYTNSSWQAVPPNTNPFARVLTCVGGSAYVLQGNTGFRWTGTAWSTISPTGISPTRTIQWAVASPTEIYAYADSAGVDRVYYRYNGTTWNVVGRSRYTLKSSRLWAIPGGGGAYVWGQQSRLERITPAGMSVVTFLPSLRSAAVNSSTSAFVVGYPSLLARWSGAQWTVDAPPGDTPSNRYLTSVWSDGPSSAWAVGELSTVLRWTGTTWQTVSDSLRPAGVRDQYNAVWGSGGTVWIVGDQSILRCSGVLCANESATVTDNLFGIWGTSPTNIFAVGRSGQILRYNGSSWTRMASPTTRALGNVSGSSASDVWAVGDSVLLHFDGSAWSQVPWPSILQPMLTHVPTQTERQNFSNYRGITGPGLFVRGPREVYLGSQLGWVARYDSEWRAVSSPLFNRNTTGIGGTPLSDRNGCVLAVTAAQVDLDAPTLRRGLGANGCFATTMGSPTSWP